MTNPRTGSLGNTGSSGRGVLVFDESVLGNNFQVLNFLVYDTVFGTLALIIPFSHFFFSFTLSVMTAADLLSIVVFKQGFFLFFCFCKS